MQECPVSDVDFAAGKPLRAGGFANGFTSLPRLIIRIKLMRENERSFEMKSVNRKILSLAIPALGSLLAEPLMILADSAMIGHVGTTELAGLTLGASVNAFVVGIDIFLVYTTTAVASRHLGAGRRQAAIKTGVDGSWLGIIIGLAVALILFVFAPQIIALFRANAALSYQGVIYLRAAAPSMVGMMLTLAGTGAMRGQLDARTPLIISVAGAALNVVLNACFIYGLNLGVLGAGVGTSLASTLMGLSFGVIIVLQAKRAQVSFRPQFQGIFASLKDGIPLMIRTLTMHGVILSTLWVAASQGEVSVAGRQIAANTWTLSANLLDALAIASQSLIGFELGRGDKAGVRELISRVRTWGVGVGCLLGLVVAACAAVWPLVFTSDPKVIAAARAALLVSAFFEPLAGLVFIYDGILIGANDAWYLAAVGIINLAVYLPFLTAVWLLAPSGTCGLAWLWGCYCCVFFTARGLTLGLRLRQDTWMHLER